MRARARLLGVAATVLGAAGCFWPAPGAGPDRAGHNPFETTITPETVTELGEIWTATTDGGPVLHPVTSDQAVHVVARGTAYGFDAGTGERLWARTPDNPAPEIWTMGPATFADGVLWTGSGIPNLNGQYVTELLDPATGQVVGDPGSDGLVDSVRGEGFALRRPAFVGSGTNLPTLFNLTVQDSRDPEGGWGGTIAILPFGTPMRPLTLRDEILLQSGRGMSVGAGGNVVESTGIRGYRTSQQPDPCPLEDVPITVTCPTWFTELPGVVTSPVLSPELGLVYVGTSGGTIHALDPATGRVSWSAPVGAGVGADPAVLGENLYVPTVDGRLVVLGPTGALLWEGAAGSELRVQPAIAGGVVFTGAVDGTLRAFDAAGCGAQTCQPLWSRATGSQITGAPAVSDGQLYVGTADQRLIAYGLP